MAKNNNEYQKENNPLLTFLYIAAVLVLIACIVFFVYSSRQEKANYEERVRSAAEYETERQDILRESETETESGTKETEPAAETESMTEEKNEPAAEETASEPESGTESAPEESGQTEPAAEGGTESGTEEPGGMESETTPDEGLSGETGNAGEESETMAAAVSAAFNTGESESETETEPYVPEGYPRIRLKQKKVVLQVGDTFNATDYVKDITNSSENIYTLWRNIQVEGDYSMDKAGIYQLVYTVTDTAGRTSNRAVLLLEVQDPQTDANDEATVSETETAAAAAGEEAAVSEAETAAASVG